MSQTKAPIHGVDCTKLERKGGRFQPAPTGNVIALRQSCKDHGVDVYDREKHKQYAKRDVLLQRLHEALKAEETGSVNAIPVVVTGTDELPLESLLLRSTLVTKRSLCAFNVRPVVKCDPLNSECDYWDSFFEKLRMWQQLQDDLGDYVEQLQDFASSYCPSCPDFLTPQEAEEPESDEETQKKEEEEEIFLNIPMNEEEAIYEKEVNESIWGMDEDYCPSTDSETESETDDCFSDIDLMLEAPGMLKVSEVEALLCKCLETGILQWGLSATTEMVASSPNGDGSHDEKYLGVAGGSAFETPKKNARPSSLQNKRERSLTEKDTQPCAAQRRVKTNKKQCLYSP